VGYTAATEYDAFRNVQAGSGYYDNEISIVWSTAQGFAQETQYKVKVAGKECHYQFLPFRVVKMQLLRN
jgi:hypothetical protein